MRAVQFIGDGSALVNLAGGDRLTSGSLVVKANSATSVVSLTTAGTTWGYFGSAASYLPNLAAANISVTGLTVNGVSVTGAGASKLASLTDVSASAPANNSLLRYNTSMSKWEAVDINQGVSTTTMVANWPDAIMCSGTAGLMVLYHDYMNSGNIHYYFFIADPTAAGPYYVGFNNDGSYNIHVQQSTGYLPSCISKSINQLYAAGQAFNFIGNNGGSSGTGNGYALTSGTLSVTANSATSVVSMSTASTTWGYFGSNESYLPNLTAANISVTGLTVNGVSVTGMNGVSSTNGYFSGNLGVGKATPQTPLQVRNGSLLVSDNNNSASSSYTATYNRVFLHSSGYIYGRRWTLRQQLQTSTCTVTLLQMALFNSAMGLAVLVASALMGRV